MCTETQAIGEQVILKEYWRNFFEDLFLLNYSKTIDFYWQYFDNSVY